MTSNRVNQITTGLVYFVIVYGISSVICNTLQGWNIFPTYTVCMLDPVIEQEDNFVAMAFFVMPSALMANAAPIIDLVTFRLMKLRQNSRQIPKGTLKVKSVIFSQKCDRLFAWKLIICIGKKTFLHFRLSWYPISSYAYQYVALDCLLSGGSLFCHQYHRNLPFE